MPDYEDVFADAYASLKESEYWLKAYNGQAARLKYLGYHQVPEFRLIIAGPCGYSQAINRFQECAADIVLEIASEEPAPHPYPEIRERELQKLAKRDRQAALEEGRVIRSALRNDREEIGERCSWTCIYCEKPGGKEKGPDGRTWHIDHLYARVNGGDDEPDNLVLSCATCNLTKSARLLRDFLKANRLAKVLTDA